MNALELQPDILLVEDNDDDAEIVASVFKKNSITGSVHRLTNGEDALDFLFKKGKFYNQLEVNQPRIVLLDINLPKMNGIEVLRRLRSHQATENIPVFVFTSSKNDYNAFESVKLGVTAYIRKQCSFEKFEHALLETEIYLREYNVLVVEDDKSDAAIIFDQLKNSSVKCRCALATNKAEYLKALEDFQPDIIFSDYDLPPKFDALQAVRILKDRGLNIPFILVTGKLNEDLAAACLSEGMDDYVLKGNYQRLPVVLINKLRKRKSEIERSKAIEKLKHNEQRLRQAQEIAHLGSWEVDLSTGMAVWSEEHCRIYGLSPADNLQSFGSWLSFIHPDDLEYVKKITAEDTRKKDNSFFHRILRKDGTVRHIYSEYHVERNGKGVPTGIHGIAHDVTELKQTEEKLVNANRLYAFISGINQAVVQLQNEQALLTEVCNIAITIGGFDLAVIGRIDEANRRSCLVAHHNATEYDLAIFGDLSYDKKNGPTENAVSKNTYHVIRDIDGEPEQALWKQYATTRGFKSMISLPLKKSGKVIYVLTIFSGKNNFFNDEEIGLLNKTADDISFALDFFEKEHLRILAEEKIKKSEQKFRSLIENSTDAIAVLSAAGTPLYVSPSVRSILGYSSEEVMQMDIFTLAHPDDILPVQAVMAKVLNSPGIPIRGHTGRMRHKDGTWRWLEATVTNMLHDPEINGIVDNFRDITERHVAEEKTKHSELRLRQAQEIAHFGNWELNLSTMMFYWSEEACRIYGLAPDDNIHTFESWFQFIHPDDLEYVQKVAQEGMSTLTNNSFFYRIIRKDGSIRHIYTIARFEFDSNGIPVTIFGASHDLTEMKTQELKLAQANRLYAFISQVNQALVRADTEQTIFDQLCRIAVEIGKFELACIDKLDPVKRKLTLVAQNNAQPSDIDMFYEINFSDNGPIAGILNSGRFYVVDDYSKVPETSFWQKYAFSREFRSAITIPIRKSGNIGFVFSLFSKKAHCFDQQETTLLEQASADISFALDFFENEKLRLRAVSELMHKETRLRHAQAIAHIGSWELDLSTGVAEWSEEACRIYGLDPADNKQSYHSWLSFIHPDDLDHVLKIIKGNETLMKNVGMYHRIIKQDDGAVRHVHSLSNFEFDNTGKPVGLYGVVHDITEQKTNILRLETQNEQLRQIAWIQSHKVRGPLATILGLAQLFKNKDSDQTTEIIDGILASSEKLDKVIREIVDKTSTSEISDI